MGLLMYIWIKYKIYTYIYNSYAANVQSTHKRAQNIRVWFFLPNTHMFCKKKKTFNMFCEVKSLLVSFLYFDTIFLIRH